MNFKYDVTWRSSLPQLHCKEEEIINKTKELQEFKKKIT